MSTLDLTKIKHVHFIGIGGIGISALARMILGEGKEVSGTNDIESPETLKELGERGVKISFDQKPANLPEADAYVYSDAWLANNPKLIAHAKETGKPVMSYFEMLGLVARKYKVIAIAGTHGKSTTTAMVADVLEGMGLDPTSVVGSIRAKTKSNFKKGASEYMIVEADEYRRHFLNFSPQILIITNIEADHLDFYKNLEEIEKAFGELIAKVPDDGALICDMKSISRSSVLLHWCEKAEKRGVKILDYMEFLQNVPKLKIPGEHNRKNAACAVALASVMGLEVESAGKLLSQFSSTWRRFDFKGTTKSGVLVYDDYAHHPTEVTATISGLRELFPEKKIIIIFQPHLYSRTKTLFKEFTQCFKGVDLLILLPIYHAREVEDPTVSSQILAEEILKTGQEAITYDTPEQVLSYLYNSVNEGDIVVTMGAGDVYHVGEKFLATN